VGRIGRAAEYAEVSPRTILRYDERESMSELTTPNKIIAIAIDGPAGAGKSTAAKMLASDLGIVYVDSGAMYRAVAWKCLARDVSVDNTEAVTAVARQVDIVFIRGENDGDVQKTVVDSVDVTDAIRTPAVSQAASTVSAIPEVRECLVAKQRELSRGTSVVMEGRDIGTVVLPDADIKIFLTASLGERARRRFLELETKAADSVTYESVRDDTRTVSPLMPAASATIIDSEEMTARQVVDAILDLCSRKRSHG